MLLSDCLSHTGGQSLNELFMPANSVCIKEELKCMIKTRETLATLVPLMELCISFYHVGSQVGIKTYNIW